MKMLWIFVAVFVIATSTSAENLTAIVWHSEFYTLPTLKGAFENSKFIIFR